MENVQIGLPVGGLLRTWGQAGTQLWSLDEAAQSRLSAVTGRGTLARTTRGTQRFREVTGLDLSAECAGQGDGAGAALVLATGERIEVSRVGDQVSARDTAAADFVSAIAHAVRHAATTFEYVVVEVGGAEAPMTPYAFFALHVDPNGRQLSTLEVSPPPTGSELWKPHCSAGAKVASVSAPVSEEAIDGAAIYLADAVSGLGLLPWDVALTFGVRLP